jgi:hypothetical protein
MINSVNWRDWELGFSNDYGNDFMKDVIYKNKSIKMHETTWKMLKDKRKRSGLSWNMFLLELLKRK